MYVLLLISGKGGGGVNSIWHGSWTDEVIKPSEIVFSGNIYLFSLVLFHKELLFFIYDFTSKLHFISF